MPSNVHARDILFGLRFGLDLYCNVRPVICLHDRLMPLKGRTSKDCNFVVFRENTEGIYVSIGGHFKKGTPDEIAINEDINTRKGVERICRAAFDYAVAHGRRRMHVVDKSNAMAQAHELWKRCFFEIAREYPQIESRHQFVDAFCMNVVRDPSQFDVVVTCNLFGDIITDLGAALQGGLGMAASMNARPHGVALFEPVHGSAPDIYGKNIANPIAMIWSGAMMLDFLGERAAHDAIVRAIERVLVDGPRTRDLGGTADTTAVGEAIAAVVASGA